MRAVIATHGHCFDGLCSAALFTRLLRRVEPGPLELVYRACGYGVGQRRASERTLTGTVNAILDYRFLPSDRLSWYFDHHRTAFASASEREHFDQRVGNGRYHYDAEYSSCSKLIADIGEQRFGLAIGELAPWVEWADIVDSAAFSSAEAAVDQSSPVMQLVSVVEHHAGDSFIREMVPLLLERPLEEVARAAHIQERYRPIGERQRRFIERVRTRAELLGRVVLVDLTDAVLDTIGKFVTYALYPDTVYSVVVAKLKRGAKISVGYNPWCGTSVDADLSEICARHGGGGHRVVGAISFESAKLPYARQVARDIALELCGESAT